MKLIQKAFHRHRWQFLHNKLIYPKWGIIDRPFILQVYRCKKCQKVGWKFKQSVMTTIEKMNITTKVENWAEQCVKLEAFPVLFVAMPERDNGKGALLWTGGNYTTEQIKVFLKQLIEGL